MPSVHKAIVAPEFSLQGAAARPLRGGGKCRPRPSSGESGLSAALNAVALVALLASSDVLSGKSPHVHQAFVGSIGWFGIGVLFSGAAVIFYHFTRHYYGEGG